jgi:hypothetical protein
MTLGDVCFEAYLVTDVPRDSGSTPSLHPSNIRFRRDRHPHSLPVDITVPVSEQSSRAFPACRRLRPMRRR